ncbi:LmbU family transcriptional regulator [Microbispora sp. RL4-1S]|uniref:LmbU family transcriptional regulator n=2 Tax=Microbispora oryzae TaxID=2806554 RepID=A0A940WLG7_9ACTN|nr:LmbU family transcriptional regulator [Microbispora oryzae]
MRVIPAGARAGAPGNTPVRRRGYPPAPQERLGVNRVAETRRTGLRLPAQLPVEEWQRIGEQISLISDSSNWWLGDWLVYGQKEYPDRYRLAVQRTSLDLQTLRNYAWVAKKVDVSRRRPRLSLQHHAEVAALSADQQDWWLDQAEHEGWSRNELRRRIRADRTNGTDALSAEAVIRVQASVEQRSSWEDAAARADCDFTAWVVRTLDEAADRAART